MQSRLNGLFSAIKTRATFAFDQVVTALQTLPPVQDPREKRLDSPRNVPNGEFQDLPITIIGDWTIPKIREALNAHVLGNFALASQLVEAMLADDRIQGAVNGRLKAVTKCESVFTPSEELGGQAISDELEQLFPQILPEDTEEGALTWSSFLGFFLLEVIWESKTFKGNERWIPRLKLWHPQYIYFDQQYRHFMAITQDAGIVPIIPGDPKWFLFCPWGEYRGWIRGAVRSCAIPWVVRQYALRDWGRFSEKHGLPMIVAKVPAQSSAEDKARFFGSVRNIGSDTALQLPTQAGSDGADWDVQLLEARDTSWQAFPGLIQTCDQSITLSIRGTNLTTNVEGGSHAAAKAHREEDSDLAMADRIKLSRAIKAQLLEPYCIFNFGSKDLCPDFEFVSPETNPQDEADVLLKVSTAAVNFAQAGWTLDQQLTADKFSIELSQDVSGTPKPSLVPSNTDSGDQGDHDRDDRDD